jgi:hypothetical protein
MDKRQNIAIANREGIIQEIGGRRKFSLSFTLQEIPSYILKVLKDGSCNGILKIDFVEKGGTIWLFYDFSGYIQFKDIIFQWINQDKCLAKELLCGLTKVIDCLLNVENHLIPPEEFSLDLDTIFVNPTTFELKLACLPGSSKELTIQEGVIKLISKTNSLIDDEQWSAYSQIIKEKIHQNNYGLHEIRKLLSEKSREIYCKDWPAKTLEREVIEEDNDLYIKEEKVGLLKKFFSFEI